MLAIGTTAPGNIADDFSGGLQASGIQASSVVLSQLTTPTLTSVMPTGGSASMWTYVIVAKDVNGNVTAASSAVSTSAGAATLTASAFNTLSFSRVPGAYSYDVYRTAVATSLTTTGKVSGIAGISIQSDAAFLQGTQTTVYTITSYAPFASLVGQMITVAGCASAANNGTFLCTASALHRLPPQSLWRTSLASCSQVLREQ